MIKRRYFQDENCSIKTGNIIQHIVLLSTLTLLFDNIIHSLNAKFLSHYPLICNEIFGEAILWTQREPICPHTTMKIIDTALEKSKVFGTFR